MIETKVKPSTGNTTKLLIHIVKRKPDGSMCDETLCGKMWDHPVVNSKDFCEECLEIAERDGHDWRKK